MSRRQGPAGRRFALPFGAAAMPGTGAQHGPTQPQPTRRYIPIIASVSEHQPTTWATYVFDLHLLPFAAPAGLYFCFK